MLREKNSHDVSNDENNLIEIVGLSGTVYIDDKTTPNLDTKEPATRTSKELLNWGIVPGCAEN